jgi:hypothetical protein
MGQVNKVSHVFTPNRQRRSQSSFRGLRPRLSSKRVCPSTALSLLNSNRQPERELGGGAFAFSPHNPARQKLAVPSLNKFLGQPMVGFEVDGNQGSARSSSLAIHHG